MTPPATAARATRPATIQPHGVLLSSAPFCDAMAAPATAAAPAFTPLEVVVAVCVVSTATVTSVVVVTVAVVGTAVVVAVLCPAAAVVASVAGRVAVETGLLAVVAGCVDVGLPVVVAGLVAVVAGCAAAASVSVATCCVVAAVGVVSVGWVGSSLVSVGVGSDSSVAGLLVVESAVRVGNVPVNDGAPPAALSPPPHPASVPAVTQTRSAVSAMRVLRCLARHDGADGCCPVAAGSCSGMGGSILLRRLRACPQSLASRLSWRPPTPRSR